MPVTLQHTKVSCRGGLDLRSTSQELLSKPGYAQQLDNFECGHRGGYLRINGYTPYGINPVPGTGAIKGIEIFNDSILVARGDDLYHTFDASTWVQINKVVTGANLATLTAAPATALNINATDVKILPYQHGTALEEQIVTIVNGYDEVMVFTVSGTDHNTATYSFEFLDETLTAAPAGASFGYVFKDQVYLSGVEAFPSSVFVSALVNPKSYNTTQSGEYAVADNIKWLQPFRDQMIIFCEHKIMTLKDANSIDVSLQAITTDVGCISGGSVQEIGGDLVFWAKDGLRTLAGTDKIDDVELSSISTIIQPFFQDTLAGLDEISAHSVVLREKDQYRLYFPRLDNQRIGTTGVIGTIVATPEGGMGWNWSLTKGLAPKHVTEGFFNNLLISLMSTEDDGVLYQHDTGASFNGFNITAIFKTPYADMGDPSIRKNIHRVRTYIKPEGDASVSLVLNYTGYGSSFIHNPAKYSLGELRTPAVYGSASYGTNYTYGARVIDNTVINTEGSGFTYSMTYSSTGLDDQYNIQGYDLDFIASGKV